MRRIVSFWIPVLATLFTLPAHGSCLPTPDGIMAWWSFDENAGGEIAHDRAYGQAGGQHGIYSTLTGPGKPQPVAGKVGNGLNFLANGRGFVEVPHNQGLNVDAHDFSVDFWMQAKPHVGLMVLLDKRLPSAPYTGYHLFSYNGKLGLQLADAKGYTNYGSSAVVADGKPHFVAVTVARKSADGIRWYLDGQEVLPRANPTGRPGSLANTQPLRIGARNGAPSGFFNGVLDELEIFERALTPKEIQDLWQAGSDGKCKCTRTDNVPFSGIGAELANLRSCVDRADCRKWTEVEYVPIQDLPTKYDPLWFVEGLPQPPIFDLALQDKILADADSQAAQGAPKCSNGKTKTTVDYQLRATANYRSYGIFWRIKYGCC